MRYIFFLFLALGFTACNLEQEIELELPVVDNVTVVECYLQPGEPYNLLLSRTAGYFEPFPTEEAEFIQDLLVTGATVRIIRGEEVIELEEGFFLNPIAQKFFNYGSNEIVPEDYDSDFQLEITTADGQTITAQTRILEPVPIDSVVVQFNGPDTLGRALMYLTDDMTEANFYRNMLHEGSLDSIPDFSFPINDEVVDEGTIVFGTNYSYAVGDTIFHSLFHIESAYYDFLVSLSNAVGSNGNPFAQPGGIISNVEGEDAIGIFTGFSADRVMTIVEE
ncbi:MAG: DUF4249 domain-containing protein [Bacteroidetes bacterium]|nr:DUF4249 domain-containing protein [Bacteroidota bacterium]